MDSAELHVHVHDRFRKAFGPPTHVLGGADQWAMPSPLSGTPVHVLLNGTSDHPTVWVFDPHDHHPYRTMPARTIEHEDQIDEVLDWIRHTVDEADEFVDGASQPARIEGFVEAIRDWSTSLSHCRRDAARVDVERARIFAKFLSEDDHFRRVYRGLSFTSGYDDATPAVAAVCAFLNAVGESVTTRHQR